MAASCLSCVMWNHFLVVCVLSWFVVCGILVHWPGIKPTSPALQGEFLTTGPPGKSLKHNFKYHVDLQYCVSDKYMATHSSTLVWKIPWMEESGRLLSMGSQRVRHDWVTPLHIQPEGLFSGIFLVLHLMAESEELRSLLMKAKEGWKSWLKAQHSES